MPDRRSFLKGTALTVPALALSRLGEAQSVNFPTQPFYTAATNQLIATTNAAMGTPSSNAFNNQEIGILGVKNVWSTYSLDKFIKQQAAGITEADIYPNPRINVQTIYNAYKPYYPSLTFIGLAEAIQAIALAANSSGVSSQVLYNLRQIGAMTYINEAINETNSLASQSTFPRPPQWNFIPKAVPYDNGNDIPRTGDNPGCKYDGAAILAVSTALLVITIMTDGLDLLVGAAWGAVAWWGGVGVGGWSIMHAMKCGF